MKKLALIFSLLAVCGFMLGACGGNGNGGPKCEKDVECDPACATDGTEVCDLTNGTCIVLGICGPACATDGTEYCDPLDGTWKAMCDPACATDGTEYCDDGTCKKFPVCDPACAADEHCVP